jgi:hypothetical protein
MPHYLLKLRVFGRIGVFRHMSKPAAKCVFCGETGVTKSHIWPDWLDAYLPPRAASYLQTIGEVNTFLPKMRRPALERRVGRGDARARKPRNTCAQCNSGWMSRIEANAKDAIIPLVQGQAFIGAATSHTSLLNSWGQRAIASLLCLITMRVEFSHMATRAATDDHRKWIREPEDPPPFWKVWIARYAGQNPSAHWCRHYGLQLVSTPDEIVADHVCDTQVTTFVMGHLCAHVFSSTTIPTFEGYSGQGLCRLWPLTGWDINCRFLPSINDEAVLSLAEALAREIPAIPE